MIVYVHQGFPGKGAGAGAGDWRSTKGKAGVKCCDVLWRKRWSGCGSAEKRGCRASGGMDGTSKPQNLSFTRRIWGSGKTSVEMCGREV
jgi:hypothetical protein